MFEVLGRGRSTFFGSPPSDIFCIAGPPGKPNPQNLDNLSKASPAASSMVEPKRLYLPHSSTKTICVCPPETSNDKNGGSMFGCSIRGALKCPTI